MSKTSFLRYPKTQSERRKVAKALASGVKIRSKRNVKNLPDAWDDIAKARGKQGWKQNKKKHQYESAREELIDAIMGTQL